MKGVVMMMPFLLLSACFNERDMIRKFAAPDDDQFARHFIGLMQEGRYDEADPMLESKTAAQAGGGRI